MILSRRLFSGICCLTPLLLSASPAFGDAFKSLDWPDLLPKGEAEVIARGRMAAMIKAAPHGSFDDQPASRKDIQILTFNTVKALDRAKVKLKGYVVPLDVGRGKMKEFLLVPYFGACIHAPPPPPNQTVYVKASTPVALPNLSSAVEVAGTLRVSKTSSDMGASAYSLDLASLTVLK